MIIAILAMFLLPAQIPGCTFFTVRLSSFLPGRGFNSRAAYIRSANYLVFAWMRLAYEKFTRGETHFGRLYFHRYGVNALGTLS